MLDAAAALFLESGYASTTIDAISNASAVPSATVYRLFTSKQGILRALLDRTIAGDDEPVTVAERPEVQSLMRAPEPREVLARLAAVSVGINTRTSPVYRILVSAADSDAEAAALLHDLTEQRQAGQGRVAATLARSKSLRRGLRAGDAADVIHALASPELYRLLVVDRNWSTTRYEQWLAEALATQLLD